MTSASNFDKRLMGLGNPYEQVAQYLLESSMDGIIATPGGGQANAFQLTTQTARIAVVATAGDSIKLPASAAGLEVIVINHGANSMQVYGAGADTVNDVAAATGVAQMANSTVIYSCAAAGAWYTEGLATGFTANGSLQTLQAQNGVTAFAGGGQASATPLTGMISRITTVATAGDSVKLPAAAAGLSLTVVNNGANPVQVFGSGTDTINGAAAATGVTQMQNSICVYTCAVAGLWQAEGIGSGYAGSLPTVSASNGLVATAAGTQGTALLLPSAINRVTTVATIGDAVKLQPSAPGLQQIVTNASANSMNVFPNTGDAINGAAANAAYALAGGKTATLTCAGTGFWHAVLSA